MGSSFRIRRITIEGFRRIQEKLTLDLVDPKGNPVDTFVIAGPNGCGKTSVLEAVLLSLGHWNLLHRPLPTSSPKTRPLQSIDFGQLDSRCVVKVDLRSVLADGEFSDIGVELTRNGYEVEELGKKRKVHSAELPAEVDGLPVAYFSSLRSARLVGPVRPFDSTKQSSSDESDRLWRIKEQIINERARRGFPQSRASYRDGEWLAAVNRAWRKFRGGDGTSIDALVSHEENGQTHADLYVLDTSLQKICSVDELSSGEIEILTLAGWMILNNVRSGIVIIDEPELHLHPQWQATILPALRTITPDSQFIIATHADAPWDAAMSYERVLLVPREDPRSNAWREAHFSVRETPDD